MRFSVACLVVWPELWLTRGDPRLGKRPFIESIALSPYTPISPAALLAYAIPQSSSLSCSSNNYYTQTLAHRPLVARRFTVINLPSNRYLLISRITSQLPTARYSYLWVVSNRHFPLEALRISPNRYDIARGTFIPRILAPVVESPFAFPPGLVINNIFDKPISTKANHTFMR